MNPFPLTAYHGPDYFCDREDETRHLISNALNGAHTTLISIRRMGKTILLKHVLNQLSKKRQVLCVYADIHATLSQKDLLNQVSTAILQSIPDRKAIGSKILDFIKGLRPVISYNSLTNQPELSFDWQSPPMLEKSLQSLFQFLDKLDKTVVVAIDEFQQIASYPETNTEAVLRSAIQPLKNVRFILSGSSRHLLASMFAGSKRPFYGFSQMTELSAIGTEAYAAFITRHFKAGKRKIDAAALDFILQWTRRHTWFTQVLCNRLYADGQMLISLPIVQSTANRLLKEQEPVFFQYRSLLTSAQWQTLAAIAKEEKVYKPGARDFLYKYRLGTPSSVKRSMDALLEKEMILLKQDEGGSFYQVYDCFLSRWLEQVV